MKMNNVKKIVSCILSAILLFGAVACGDKEETPTQRVLTAEEVAALGDKVPDYSSYTDKFDFFAYSSVSDGTWTDGAYSYDTGVDLRTPERIQEFKESGLTIVMPQRRAGINEKFDENFDFENSDLKNVMDMAYDAGLKVMVTDFRLYLWVREGGCILPGETDLATEEELDALVQKYMQPYVEHPAFYGIQLLDEPAYKYLEGLGVLYKSIQRCFPGLKVIMNMMPPMTGVGIGEGEHFPQPTKEETQVFLNKGFSPMYAERLAAFIKYLTMFLDYTGAEYIMYDHYPLRARPVDSTYVCGMQAAAELAKERNVDFYLVSESFSFDSEIRMMSDEDLRWLNNMSMGFGVDMLAYYTYFTTGEFMDGCSFITFYGDKTQIYYDMQKILAENQKFAPVIKQFDYKASATYIKPLSMYNNTHVAVCANNTLTKIESFENDKESTLITELYDDENDRYMYMIQNAIDPAYKASTTYQTVTVKFNTNYEYAVVWKNAEKSVVKLVDNTYVVSQQPGEAVFVLPFNA